jgi:hypothetical protein
MSEIKTVNPIPTYHTTKSDVGIKKIIKAMEQANDPMITIEYKPKSTKKHKKEVVFDFAEAVQNLSVFELMGQELSDTLGDMYEAARSMPTRIENYTCVYEGEANSITNELATTEAGYLLFQDAQGEFKSVLPTNIVSVAVDGVKYVK